MSYQIGIDTIRLKGAPRLAHTEYCDHKPLMEKVERETGLPFRDAWQYDLVWVTDDGPTKWGEAGRVTDMGHAAYVFDGSDRRDASPSPFAGPEDVLAFDAVEEYGLVEFDTLVDYCRARHAGRTASRPGQVVPGGYYKTIVSGAIEAFGWENLLEAAADPDAFERVLDSFFRLSLHHYRAWAEAGIEVFICHDDMVWTQGPFMRPEFYRRVIFPRYRELWRPLRERGVKVLYCSDGDWTMFLGDIADAGADGFIFEPVVPLDEAARRFGRTHVLVGSCVDCRTMAFKGVDEVRAEMDRTFEIARGCAGFVFAVGNHIPANVPVETAEFYFDYLASHWGR